jgi:hypothetical protein
MDTSRPFSGPISVTLAALTLLALAAASFTSGLTRQMRLPRPVNTAQVVVMPPKATPPPTPIGALAYTAPAELPAPVKPRRHTPPAATETPPTPPSETPAGALAATDSAGEAAAVVSTEPLVTTPTAPAEPAAGPAP